MPGARPLSPADTDVEDDPLTEEGDAGTETALAQFVRLEDVE